MNLKKGQILWVKGVRGKDIFEDNINSIGKKYITMTFNPKIKFDRITLREVDSVGSAKYLILDILDYNRKVYYNKLRESLRTTDWESIEERDLDILYSIVKKYNK